jgi:hypothetical protein
VDSSSDELSVDSSSDETSLDSSSDADSSSSSSSQCLDEAGDFFEDGDGLGFHGDGDVAKVTRMARLFNHVSASPAVSKATAAKFQLLLELALDRKLNLKPRVPSIQPMFLCKNMFAKSLMTPTWRAAAMSAAPPLVQSVQAAGEWISHSRHTL